ncbi:hypothetical protein RchiOBHm_Chr4g0398121 [Rosa chinensis]|uniref:Uncharacterized protein n=1 Tax=Rosa chinensis TaxID=74649 RepID=A0A2P6QS80_ROSCH|nr:hypothetical protein RchiOBHm_Chr4g0398121 [Rosa chinensis]
MALLHLFNGGALCGPSVCRTGGLDQDKIGVDGRCLLRWARACTSGCEGWPELCLESR